jgi:pyrroline-5-carboxylate reductase
MRIGLIGAGNMASALARGLGEPATVADVDRERAEALAAAIGGSVARSNVEAADGSDVVILCHKPPQLAAVAEEIRDHARAVVSILGGTPVATVEDAYPERPVYRFMPSIPVEVRQGVVCYVPGARAAEGPEAEVRELFGRLGPLVELPVHWRLDDVPYWMALRDPREVLAIWTAEHDHAHGAHLTYTIHPELTGRGHRLTLLDGLLDHTGPTVTHGDAAAAA